jgi:hypothetical protein
MQCKPGLWCDAEGSGNCESARAEGESCEGGAECADGLTCSYTAESATCVAETGGETCEIPADGGSDADAGGDGEVDAGPSGADAGM